MSQTILHRTETLQDQLIAILTERIASREYAPGTQFPSEAALKEEFGVSRATVRSAVSALVSRGLLFRRRGVGTYVGQPTMISNPIGEAMDFHQLISESGFEPGVSVGRTAIATTDEELASELGVAVGSKVLQTEKVFTANGSAVIYVVNVMPAWVLGEELLLEAAEHPEITEPIYAFLEERCRQRVEYHVATLWADLLENLEIEAPELDPAAPLLVMQSVACNPDGRPVLQSLSVYPDKRMQFRLVRRRASAS